MTSDNDTDKAGNAATSDSVDLTETARGPALIVVAGEHIGRTFQIDGEVSIGREGDTEVRLDGVDVSRRHARIYREHGTYFVEDLNSRNGTRVNGVPVKSRELRFGDRITIGTAAILLFSQSDRLEEEFNRRQRLEDLGRLVGGITHDLNNLLGALLANCECVHSMPENTSLRDEILRDTLRDTETATRRAVQLSRQLLAFVRHPAGQLDFVDVSEVAAEVLRLIDRTIRPAVTIKSDIEGDCCAIGDAGQIHQVLTNLCINASDAIKETGSVTLRVRSESPVVGDPGSIIIEVEDDGIGMDWATKSRAVEPFFTTKARGRGTGVGLAVVQQIVNNHGGVLEIESEPGEKTLVRVTLPRASGQNSATVDLANTGADDPVEALTVMLVDDEDLFRTSTARALRGLGYHVIEARSGQDAIEIYRESVDRIQAVIVDVIMPEMDGEATIKELFEIDPNLKALMISGFDVRDQSLRVMNLGASGFLRKPFELQKLRAELGSILVGA